MQRSPLHRPCGLSVQPNAALEIGGRDAHAAALDARGDARDALPVDQRESRARSCGPPSRDAPSLRPQAACLARASDDFLAPGGYVCAVAHADRGSRALRRDGASFSSASASRTPPGRSPRRRACSSTASCAPSPRAPPARASCASSGLAPGDDPSHRDRDARRRAGAPRPLLRGHRHHAARAARGAGRQLRDAERPPLRRASFWRRAARERRHARPARRATVVRETDTEVPYWRFMNEDAIAEINAQGVDLAVIKGDIADVGRRDQFEAAARAFAGFRMPHHAFLGNHDYYGLLAGDAGGRLRAARPAARAAQPRSRRLAPGAARDGAPGRTPRRVRRRPPALARGRSSRRRASGACPRSC